MYIDRETQDIWHFFGAFHLATEEAKQRAEFDAFRMQKAKDAASKLELLDRPFAAPYSSIGFVPGVTVNLPSDEIKSTLHTISAKRANAAENAAAAQNAVVEQNIFADQAVFAPDYTYTPEEDVAPEQLPPINLPPDSRVPEADITPTDSPPLDIVAPAPFYMTMPHPSSVIVVGNQVNRLLDNDTLIQTDFGVAFTDVRELDALLDSLMAVAQTLQPFGKFDHPADNAALKQTGYDIYNGIETVSAAPGATVLRGEATTGMHVDGLSSSEPMPQLGDHLPEVPEMTQIPLGTDWVEVLVEDGPPEAEHVAVTGGNTLINEVVVSSSWIDAPVILVEGDALHTDVIVQTNTLSESMQSPNATASASTTINAAMFGSTSVPLPEVPENLTGLYPSNWVITTLTADLVQMNWMQQQNYLIDNDIVSFSWMGASTQLRLGDNSLVNMTALNELGFFYDLIVVGGDLINVSMITQMNVLLDADWVATDDGAATILAGDNLLFNSAIISNTGTDTMLPMDAAHAALSASVASGTTGPTSQPMDTFGYVGFTVLNVLYITGDMLTLDLVEQINVLGDSDQVAAAMSQASIAQGAEVTVVTGANALANLAVIQTSGIDSTIHVAGDLYSDALLYQANFIDADSADPYAANGIAELSTEAVVFLADDMLGGSEDNAQGTYDAGLNMGQADGLNAVLA